MKYLKTYKLFENKVDIQSVINTVKDILVEISDDDVYVSVKDTSDISNKTGLLCHQSISVMIGDNDEYMDYDMVKEYNITKYIDNLKYMNEYLESEGFNYDFIHCVSYSEDYWGDKGESQFDDFLDYLKRVKEINVFEIVYRIIFD